ncbi:MAG: hypothetical protein ACRC7G_02105 [Beijerinckiaceae bacterium]
MAGKHTDLSSLWLTPFVMASRMPIIWFEAMNPDPSRRDETNRMISEKVIATQEGMVAVQVALGSAVAENMAAMAFGLQPRATASNTASAMMRAGLAPAAKRVKANARRLAKGG